MASRKVVNPASRGGIAVVKQYGIQHMRNIGSKGGQVTAKRYGRGYMANLGQLGADAVNGHLSKTRRMMVERNIRRILQG